MKAFSLMSLFLLAFSQPAFSRDNAFEKLTVEAQNRSIFTQTTDHPDCPQTIVPEIQDQDNEDAPENSVRIALDPIDGRFSFEGNRLSYVPGLKVGKTHSHRKTHFLLGVAFINNSQREENGILTLKYSSKIASVFMIAKSNFEIQYDSNKQLITYKNDWNKMILCKFEKLEHE